MTELHASRTLVKSAPELWAECSDAASLARHLGAFGEIRITRVEPETAVAWEGEQVSGTVRLEPAGWGTKVVLTAETAAEAAAPEPPPPELTPEPQQEAPPSEPQRESPAPEPRHEAPPPVILEPPRGLFARLLAVLRPAPSPSRVAATLPRPPEAVELEPEDIEPEELEPAMVESAEPEAPPEPLEAPVAAEPLDANARETEAALVAALDSLGQAHHRPFSRA